MTDTQPSARWTWAKALNSRPLAVALVAVLQLGVLGSMVAGQVRLLSRGQEIVLKSQPVDPRDFFKGDYVRLQYDISRLPADLAATMKVAPGKPAYVSLVPTPAGVWAITGVSGEPPSAPPSATQVVLRAEPMYGRMWNGQSPLVRYGLEQYFVPEGTGHNLEQLAREKRLDVIVAVGPDGISAIKGLAIDGKRIYDEPLF